MKKWILYVFPIFYFFNLFSAGISESTKLNITAENVKELKEIKERLDAIVAQRRGIYSDNPEKFEQDVLARYNNIRKLLNLPLAKYYDLTTPEFAHHPNLDVEFLKQLEDQLNSFK